MTIRRFRSDSFLSNRSGLVLLISCLLISPPLFVDLFDPEGFYGKLSGGRSAVQTRM
jgi:hypothetical protein